MLTEDGFVRGRRRLPLLPPEREAPATTDATKAASAASRQRRISATLVSAEVPRSSRPHTSSSGYRESSDSAASVATAYAGYGKATATTVAPTATNSAVKATTADASTVPATEAATASVATSQPATKAPTAISATSESTAGAA